MNLSERIFMVVFTAALMLSISQAQERKIRRSQLPRAVEETVAKESEGATIKGFATEIEKGQKMYEVELTVNGHGKDILMDKQGNIVEIEEEVTMDSLSAAVREGLQKAAGAGTIGMIESLTKRGKLVAYEAHVRNGKKRFEIQVGPKGEKLRQPE